MVQGPKVRGPKSEVRSPVTRATGGNFRDRPEQLWHNCRRHGRASRRGVTKGRHGGRHGGRHLSPIPDSRFPISDFPPHSCAHTEIVLSLGYELYRAGFQA